MLNPQAWFRCCLTCWISLSWLLTVSRRCLRSVSEESSSRRMELLRPSACCNICAFSSTSEWAILKRSSRSLFSCSCGSSPGSQHLLHWALNRDRNEVFSCLCGHELLDSGHLTDVGVDPQLQLILLMQSLLHLHVHCLHDQKQNRRCCDVFIISFLLCTAQRSQQWFMAAILLTYLVLSGHCSQVILQPPVLPDYDFFVSPEGSQLSLTGIQLLPQACYLPLTAV